MSIDKSLKRRASLARQRSVLTRMERINILKEQDRWEEGRSPFGLPKVRVVKLVLKKTKKAKTEEGAEGAAASADAKAAAPAKEAKKK
jgi:small basic protein (TIGR04137 family)